ncbi:glycosyltransferase family 4 protein [Paraclostridium bifermentans]|uniref:glycosyltransferase family 4 protein n=1 Tax=Paraclostridium bifermentans TaxID=1490 RepID=UPI00115A51ED|nr:glycosyltransferase family 4 protein [Paraclostridium bifermentans]TQO58788.1 hypothetical protein D5S05_03965 [Paraclostridium bifermentans]
MKILLISHSFFPTVSARANRTFELAKEFSRQGNKVDIVIPSNNYDYEHMEDEYKFKIIKIGKINSITTSKSYAKRKPRKVLNAVKRSIRYIIGGEWYILYFVKDILSLKEKIDRDYDLAISIGLPFSTHIGYYLLHKKVKFSKVSIADYGDPYSYNKTIKKPSIYKIIEKHVSNYFDFITIPTEKAKPCYKFIKNDKKIKIIPQGFEIKDYSNLYKKNSIPTFAFAGNFYKDIRNPIKFFNALKDIDREYKLVLYANLKDLNQIEFIEYAKDVLKDKVEVNHFLDREDCIIELSKMDFLINILNLTDTQVPSKLIDYTISGRPILNIIPDKINIEEIKMFLNSKYDYSNSVNLMEFNIKNVAEKFVRLVEEKETI